MSGTTGREGNVTAGRRFARIMSLSYKTVEQERPIISVRHSFLKDLSYNVPAVYDIWGNAKH